jgi:hypothetical protein
MATQKLYWLTFSVPKDWTQVDTNNENELQFTPTDGGLVHINFSGNTNWSSDVRSDVDKLVSQLESGSDSTVENLEQGACGNAVTFTGVMKHTSGNTPNQGYVKFIISGHGMYLLTLLAPTDSYSKYDDVFHQVMDSMTLAASTTPLGAADSSSASSSAATSSATTTAATTNDQPKTYKAGTYLVGTDMPAGTYKLTATTSSPGYWEVTNSAAPDADIVGNDNFDNSAYVSVEDGQYLKLNRCTAVQQ